MRKLAIAAIVVAIGVGLGVGGWYVAFQQHQRRLESEWAGILAIRSGDAEVAAACDRFLAAFPDSHLFGNRHADEAKARADVARRRLADEERRRDDEKRRLEALAAAEVARRAEAEAMAKAAQTALTVRDAVRAVLQDRLFDLLGAAPDLGRGSVFLRASNRGVHELVYGSVLLGPVPDADGARLLDPKSLDLALGRKVYDETAHRLDKEALRVFLAAAYVAPGETLLGLTAKAVYPAFARRLRNELRLYRGLTRQMPVELARARAKWLEAQAGKLEGQRDWRELYRAVYEQTDTLRALGIAPCELRAADLGFWVRRIDDGTAVVLGEFLEKVVAAYDGEWLSALSDPLQPFTATTGWAGGDPVQIVKKGARWTLEENGQTFDACARGFRADPPEKAPASFADERTSDRLVRRLAAGPWAEASLVVGFTADSKQLVTVEDEQLYFVDAATLQVARTASLPRATALSARWLSHRGTLLRTVQEGWSELFDGASGAALGKFGGFVVGDVDEGATVMARLSPKKGDEAGSLEVRYHAGEGEWAATRVGLPNETFDQVKVHPSGENRLRAADDGFGHRQDGLQGVGRGCGRASPGARPAGRHALLAQLVGHEAVPTGRGLGRGDARVARRGRGRPRAGPQEALARPRLPLRHRRPAPGAVRGRGRALHGAGGGRRQRQGRRPAAAPQRPRPADHLPRPLARRPLAAAARPRSRHADPLVAGRGRREAGGGADRSGSVRPPRQRQRLQLERIGPVGLRAASPDGRVELSLLGRGALRVLGARGAYRAAR
ncbi:MAG: hypothetical protein QM765_51895 [Myxococcales bacterium]